MSKERKIQKFVAKGKDLFIGLEDSKKTWKVCVRADKEIIHQATMPARYDVLKGFLANKFPDCTNHVVYEAGFRGFRIFGFLGLRKNPIFIQFYSQSC